MDMAWCDRIISKLDILAALAYAKYLASARRLLALTPGAKLAHTSEIQFVVEEIPNGGYVASAINVDIFTEADDLLSLRVQVRDAVRCHFAEEELPGRIRLYIAQEEVFSV